MLTGEESKKIKGVAGSYLSEGIFDIALTSLEFNKNIKAHVFVSWLHPFKEQKLVVVGSQAMAVFDDISKEKIFIYLHKIKWIITLMNLHASIRESVLVVEQKSGIIRIYLEVQRLERIVLLGKMFLLDRMSRVGSDVKFKTMFLFIGGVRWRMMFFAACPAFLPTFIILGHLLNEKMSLRRP